MVELPGGALASRPLHFFWVCDTSGSMSGAKIQALNVAVREAVPAMRDAAEDNPNAQVMVRALQFSSGAQWVNAAPVKLDDFRWDDLNAGGETQMGRGLAMVADQLKSPPMPQRALPPVVVLVSDGQPTDDFNAGLKAFMDEPWGKKAVRIGIAIGEDADLDVLQRFIGQDEIKPLVAQNSADLTRYIKWVSTAVLKAASAPASQTPLASGSAVPIPLPQAPSADPAGAGDVW